MISHFKADTITYDEPTIPPELQIEPRTESRDVRILCVHHKTTTVGPTNYANHMHNIGTSLQLPPTFHTVAPPTPINTRVNRCKNWSQLPYPPPYPCPIFTTFPHSQIITYAFHLNTRRNSAIILMVHLSHPKP